MSDYIKREDALSEMAKAECGLEYEECTDCSCSYICRIRDIPSADVVEVVRCKDCKYAEVADPEDSQDGYICQFHRGFIWFSGSYCSFGERADA